VSFAASLKGVMDDWGEWEARFEDLLKRLSARSARVLVHDELGGMVCHVAYVCEAGWQSEDEPQGRAWSKWYYEKDGKVGEEVRL
jgi:hypothetical protein